MMPAQKPHRSKQDYATPWEFFHAVESLLGEKFTFDLAAHKDNAKCECYYGEGDDALLGSWPAGLCWLNPPYTNIGEWVDMAIKETSEDSECRVVLLVPASVGSEWFARAWDRGCEVVAIRPRISFDGKDPYPKDCVLILFGFGQEGEKSEFNLWRWK